MTSCSNNIIGEDIESVINTTETKSSLISVSSGGFEGDHIDGYREALHAIINNVCGEGLKSISNEKRSINLIGMYRSGFDLEYLKNIFLTGEISEEIRIERYMQV